MSITFKIGPPSGEAYALQNIGEYIFLPHQLTSFVPRYILLKLVVCLGPLDLVELMASLMVYDGVRVMGPIPISAPQKFGSKISLTPFMIRNQKIVRDSNRLVTTFFSA